MSADVALDAPAVQGYLRETARLRSQTVRVGPYTVFVSPESPDPFLNHAIPEAPAQGRHVPVMHADAQGLGAVPDDDPAYALVRLKEAFRARGRKPRVELVAEAFPDLPPLLRAAGFAEHARTPVLCCTRATWAPTPVPAGVRVEPLLPTTPWPTIRSYLAVQREAYGIATADLDETPPEDAWTPLALHAGLLALRGERAIGAGGLARPHEGVTEIAGLATLPGERGRGVSHFLANALAKVALDTGQRAVLLLADDEGARTAGAPPGFVPCGTLVDWRQA